MKRLLLTLILLIGILPCFSQDSWHSVKTDYFLQCARNSRLPLERRLDYYDSIFDKSNRDIPFSIYCEQAELLENEGLYLRALGVYRKGAASVSKDNPADYSHLLLNSAISAYHSNRMREAISNIYELETLDNPDSLRYYNMNGYRLLSFITGSVGNTELSGKYLDLAWKEYARTAPALTRDQRNLMQCRLYFANSELEFNKRNYKQALNHLREAKKLATDSLLLSDIYGEFGRLCETENDYVAAEEFYKEAIQWKEPHPNKVISIGSYIMLLISRHRLSEAKKMLEDNEQLFSVFKGADVDRYIERIRYEVAKATGNNSGALKSLENLYALEDSIKTSQNSVYIKDLISEFEDRKKDERHRMMLEESNRKSKIITILGIIIAGVGIFSYMMWRLQKKRSKEKVALERHLTTIDSENTKRHKAMEESVELCNKEMMTMSMHAKKMKEALDNLSALVKDGAISPVEKVSKIQSALDKMSAQNNVHKMFGIYFSRVNNVFFDRLYRLQPDLSAGEIRLCGYMQIGLSSKEIAVLTNRSVRTIDNIKYSIRKKMGITESTEAYIRRVSSATDEELEEMVRKSSQSQPEV